MHDRRPCASATTSTEIQAVSEVLGGGSRIRHVILSGSLMFLWYSGLQRLHVRDLNVGASIFG